MLLLQPKCWAEASDPGQDARRAIVTKPDFPLPISIEGSAKFIGSIRTGRYLEAQALTLGFAHLSAGQWRRIDALDLTNGARDVVMLRNDNALRRDYPVRVAGDPGLDEIWLEGSAGWQIEYRDFGVVAVLPGGIGRTITLEFGPGLGVRVLPEPSFLTDPRLRNLASYPGTRDEPSRSAGLYVTRSGHVRLSANQLVAKERVDLTNGAANVVEVSPDQLALAGERVEFRGDPGLDTLLLIDMPLPVARADGWITWRIKREGAPEQIIEASGFHFGQIPLEHARD